MASNRVGFEDENVLSNVVACLVSLGYQVDQYIMDAWSYGSAQQRSRILISIAAPGLTPIAQPWHTHSKNFESTNRSLGKLPNGERLGEREFYPTPFVSLSAKDVAADLTDIGTGNTQTCISFPDHRVSCLPTIKYRSLLQHIPKSPPGCGYAQAFRLGLVPPMLELKKSETGRSYTRIKEAGLMSCITTTLRISDARNGATVHWAQDRPISIMEARRAQNYPDHEPIIGTLAQQYEIIGNGVDRMVSLAFGLALRQAWGKYCIRRSTTKSNVEFNEESMRAAGKLDNDDGYLTDVSDSIIHIECPPKDVLPAHESIASLARPKADLTFTELRSLDIGAESTRKSGSGKRSHPPKQAKFAFHDQSTKHTVGAVTKLNHHAVSNTGICSHSADFHFTKRRRERDVIPAEKGREVAKIKTTNLRKRTKIIVSTRSSSILTDKSEDSQSQPETRETSLSSMSTRQTRHSAQTIAFASVNWKKKPESKQ